MNLLQYVRSSPLRHVDPRGLQAILTCQRTCGECADACMAAIGCAPGDGFFGRCSEESKWPCKKTRSNCLLACRLWGAPTDRCGGKAWKKACSTGAVSHIGLTTTGLIGGASANRYYKCGALKACSVCTAVSGVAVLAEIYNLWNTATGIVQSIRHADDFDDCIQNLGRHGCNAHSDECKKFLIK